MRSPVSCFVCSHWQSISMFGAVCLPAIVLLIPRDLFARHLNEGLIAQYGTDLPIIDHLHDRNAAPEDSDAVAPFQGSSFLLVLLFSHFDQIIESRLLVASLSAPKRKMCIRADDEDVGPIRGQGC